MNEWGIQYVRLRQEKAGLQSSKIEKVLQGIQSGFVERTQKISASTLQSFYSRPTDFKLIYFAFGFGIYESKLC